MVNGAPKGRWQYIKIKIKKGFKMAINVQNDATFILEDGQAVNGNVFTNDVTTPNTTSELVVKPGSLQNANGDAGNGNGVIQGKYGQLTLNSDGTYSYQLTKDMNYLGAGVDLHDEVFNYTVEWHDNNGNDQSQDVELKIDIHGTNDQPIIKDVKVNAFEGGDHAGDVTIYSGQLQMEDIPGKPAGTKDLDAGDTHAFKMVAGSLKYDSADVKKALLSGVDVTVNADGTYSVTGDFDALSVGDTATVTFQYQVEDTSTAGSKTLSDPKTVTLTVVGQNDSVEIRDDYITTYDQLIDGDIYKSILANDGHYDPMGSNTMAKDIDVNDTVKIASTGYRDLDFYNGGGTISVDNAARTLAYTPGGGGAIAKDHFDFYYQATDGHTDPIGSATAIFNMENKDGQDIDWYQFGDNGDDTLCGIDGATNVLSGMGGDDYIRGKEKGDILYGGAGDDQLHGGWGNDIYKAGTGTDGMVDTRGADLYVFSKGDGRNTINDTDLEIYKDAMGHDDINLRNYSNVYETAKIANRLPGTEAARMAFMEQYADVDTVRFDASVDKTKIAIFQEDNQYGSLKIKYSENADDCVSVGWQQEEHYGIEKIEAADGTYITKEGLDRIITEISTYDLDQDATNGIQTAQNVQDVQNNAHLMNFIQAQWI